MDQKTRAPFKGCTPVYSVQAVYMYKTQFMGAGCMEKSSCLLKNLSLIFYLTCYFTKQRGSKKGVGVIFTQRGDLRPGVIEEKEGGG